MVTYRGQTVCKQAPRHRETESAPGFSLSREAELPPLKIYNTMVTMVVASNADTMVIYLVVVVRWW